MLRRFALSLGNERGSVLFLIPVLLLAAILSLALVADLGSFHYSRARLQDAADAAALAAGGAAREGGAGAAAARDEARKYIGYNLPSLKDDFTEEQFDFDPAGTVTVTLAAEAPLYFCRIFGVGAVEMRVRATAVWDDGGTSLAP